MSIIHTLISISSLHILPMSHLCSFISFSSFAPLEQAELQLLPILPKHPAKHLTAMYSKPVLNSLELGSKAQYNHAFVTERVHCNSSSWYSCSSFFAHVKTLQSCQYNCLKDQRDDGTINACNFSPILVFNPAQLPDPAQWMAC